jgi:hypothetical protein
MPLRLLLIVSIVISVLTIWTGCASQPVKPRPLFCVLDTPRNQAHCQDPKGETPVMVKRDIKDLDKNVCFTIEDWTQIQTYIDELEIEAMR